jgi:hypothetical protein
MKYFRYGSINEPSEEIKLKMLEFFLETSVPRIIEEEFQKSERVKFELHSKI